MKALKPKKGLNPSNSNHFCTRLSGPTHFWEMDGQNVHFLSIHFSKMCEAPQSCVEVIRVIRQILQGCKQKQILSIHLLKIEKKIVVANSIFLWPYNWPFDWPFWCNFFTEGVVFHEELGNAKKPKPKCVRVLSIPKMLLNHSLLDGLGDDNTRRMVKRWTEAWALWYVVTSIHYLKEALENYFCILPYFVH